MKIAIRVDASSQIGTGHVMRCLTLADALKKRGEETRFISRHLPEYLRTILAEKGHQFISLKGPSCESESGDLAHAHWLGTSQRVDALDSINALADHFWDWLIVDHYALDERWESVLKEKARNILVIDDIADRQHDCNVLLDQNFYADSEARYDNKVSAHCRLLIGPRYALLREEFCLLRESVKPRNGVVERLLVFFGGVDASNYTGLVVEALSNLGLKGVSVDVVIGLQHPCRALIESACMRHHFKCYVQTNRMGELMAAADVSIGASGSATWERCCLGLPALVIAVAKNQVDIARGLDLLGAGKCIEIDHVAVSEKVLTTIAEFIANKELVANMSEKAFSLVDGCGVARLCSVMDS